MSDADRVVCSYSEWQPLQEVIVGRLSGGVFPSWQRSMAATMPERSWSLFRDRAGTALPSAELAAADRELDQLVAVLESQGVQVERPDPADHSASFSTPNWTSSGFYSGMPRDILMVIGETIVEAPLSWRARYHEIDAYRSLIKSYFRRGARWLPAPHPQLTEPLFAPCDDSQPDSGYAITEFEPVFDAADFLRFGRDIVVQLSHVTNEFGVQWLERALNREFRVHCVEVNDPHAMHIDATLMPLAPGKLLVNPERYIASSLFRDWEVLKAPAPMLPPDWPMYFCSPWVSMNVLSLDERTIVVERQEEPLIAALTSWGFDCIPVDFRHVYSFGGAFHCVTVDVRRQGIAECCLNV